MPYSDSPTTLERIRPLLIKLELGQGDVFNAQPNVTAKKLAYKIREAFHIALLFPDRYPELAKAARTFKIQIVKPGKGGQVQAVLTDRQVGLPGYSDSNSSVAVQGLEPAGPSPLKVMGKQNATSIIEHVLKVQTIQPSNAQMSWPEAGLARDEKVKLYTWAKKQTPPWILLIADDSVTLARKSRDITEDLDWDPEVDD